MASLFDVFTLSLVLCVIFANSSSASERVNARVRRDVMSDLLAVLRPSRNLAFGSSRGLFASSADPSSPYQQLPGSFPYQQFPGSQRTSSSLNSLLLPRNSPSNSGHEYVFFMDRLPKSSTGLIALPASDPVDPALMSQLSGPARMNSPLTGSRSLLSLLSMLPSVGTPNMKIIVFPRARGLDDAGPSNGMPNNALPDANGGQHPADVAPPPVDPAMAARQSNVPDAVQRNQPPAPLPSNAMGQPMVPVASSAPQPGAPLNPSFFPGGANGQPGPAIIDNTKPGPTTPNMGSPAQLPVLTAAPPQPVQQSRPVDSGMPGANDRLLVNKPLTRPGDQTQTPTLYGSNPTGSASRPPIFNGPNQLDVPVFSLDSAYNNPYASRLTGFGRPQIVKSGSVYVNVLPIS
ncbi:nascent polypeptide-associated complex subunit alpha, muscle-specific form-like [Paramacrobiotus metropolitanus]|uniref:nascent polypeptide-associated complex subunit alpha, muscle-specific form-like n=1 Tax=Paramacrobiotus metropolitanus TaxID=2943436 RepID=UPI00244599FA|nr:nascent polypeptide-associated complex subunit alpha, muscle-specific form-like [Paramacrobiotus metropolitanus]